MPGPLRVAYQKAEAKYNVTTDFPSLGLHSAAATGNVGLVEYALEHGQPINSVLDGVLPLHAACAGGSVQVVKLLIEHGADVNAPRLPRRYSNDKCRDTSVPIVGTSGSTPLHFAAANGNSQAVTLLLLHGAHADRPDKHSVTPEMLARQNGWLECADVLKRWKENKDRDLRDRPCGPNVTESPPVFLYPPERIDSLDNADLELSTSAVIRKRLHVKQSFDNALNILKSSSMDAKAPFSRTFPLRTPPESPKVPDERGDPFYGMASSGAPDLAHVGFRRPSLPHIFPASVAVPPRSRKTSIPPEGPYGIPLFGAIDLDYENMERDRSQSSPNAGRTRKLGSKYSLLNIFKKAHSSDSGHLLEEFLPSSASPLVPSCPSPPVFLSYVPADIPTTFSLSHGNGHAKELHHSTSQLSLCKGSPTIMKKSPVMPVPLDVDLHYVHVQGVIELDRSLSPSKSKFSSDGVSKSTPSPSSSPLASLKVLRSKEIQQDGSTSNVNVNLASSSYPSCVVSDEGPSSFYGASGNETTLRISTGHNRTASVGQAPFILSNLHSLKNEKPSSPERISGKDVANGAEPHILRMSSSAGSLPKDRRGFPPGLPQSKLNVEEFSPDSAPPSITEFGEEPVVRPNKAERCYRQSALKSSDIERENSELKKLKSLQPTLLPTDQGTPLKGDESLPFRSNVQPFAFETSVHQESLQVPSLPGSNRGRGDSMSSQSTADSRNKPPLSTSDNTSGSGSDSVNTTWFPSPGHESFVQFVTDSSTENNAYIGGNANTSTVVKTRNMNAEPGTLLEGRRRFPTDLRIRSVSSHAQAEALVQKAQQNILDMTPSDLSPTVSNSGRSPLSAMLAAYGESLAIEKKFRLEMEAEKGRVNQNDIANTQLPFHEGPNVKDVIPTRPSTAEGLPWRIYESSLQKQDSPSALSASESRRLPLDEGARRSVINCTSIGVTPLNLLEVDPIDTELFLTANSSVKQQLKGTQLLDCLSSDVDLGPSLYRTCLAPLGSVRGPKTTATKLTKMGFPSTEQVRHPQPRRFGAIRSLVQTLKGKP